MRPDAEPKDGLTRINIDLNNSQLFSLGRYEGKLQKISKESRPVTEVIMFAVDKMREIIWKMDTPDFIRAEIYFDSNQIKVEEIFDK